MLVVKLEQLAGDAMACWASETQAKENCRAAWSKAVLAASRGDLAGARRQLEEALVIGEAEGGGWEEQEALRILAAETPKPGCGHAGRPGDTCSDCAW